MQEAGQANFRRRQGHNPRGCHFLGRCGCRAATPAQGNYDGCTQTMDGWRAGPIHPDKGRLYAATQALHAVNHGTGGALLNARDAFAFMCWKHRVVVAPSPSRANCIVGLRFLPMDGRAICSIHVFGSWRRVLFFAAIEVHRQQHCCARGGRGVSCSVGGHRTGWLLQLEQANCKQRNALEQSFHHATGCRILLSVIFE